jgi:hypothetical protein
MSKDRLERKAYRRSPGRQYGYDYDPLHTQSRDGQSQSGRSRPSVPGERQMTYEDLRDTNVQLAPRPDPRRTRQLLRQNILASKSRAALAGEQAVETHDQQEIIDEDQIEYEEQEDPTLYSNRYPRGNPPARPYLPISRRSMNIDREPAEAEWEESGYIDPDIDEGPLQARLRSPRVVAQQPVRHPIERGGRARRYEEEHKDDESTDEQDRPSTRRKAKKRNLTRRRLLMGLGTLAVGGTAAAVAIYELPKVPQVISEAGNNIEHQLEDAFNKGFSSGADAVRKEFITALDNLEGVSLDAATSAAKLTRVAYDVFVSPLVKFLASIADDFLTVTLRALITGRHWLTNIGQDNDTLAGLQKVLETWVQQAQQMPKQLQAIADADLDGAQAYLRALRRKIDAEQAKLNAQNTTPTAAPTPRPTRASK